MAEEMESEQKTVDDKQNADTDAAHIETAKNFSSATADPQCSAFPFPNRFTLPLRSQYLQQLYKSIGLVDGLFIDYE